MPLKQRKRLRRRENVAAENSAYSAPNISRLSEMNLQLSQEESLTGVGPETIEIKSVRRDWRPSGLRLIGNQELLSSRLNPA